jgi:hypothetical protein
MQIKKVKGKSADTPSGMNQIKESKLKALSYILPFTFLIFPSIDRRGGKS